MIFRRPLPHFKDSVRLVWQSSPRLMLTALAIALMQAIAPPLMLFILKLIIDLARKGAPEENLGALMRLVAVAVAIAMADATLRAIGGLISEAQSQVVTDRVQELVLAKSAALDLAYYEDHRYHDTFHRAQQEAPQRILRLMGSLNQLLRTAATLLGILFLLFLFHWVLIAVLFAFSIPVVLIRATYGRELHRQYERGTPLERRASYFRSLLTRIEPAKEVRLFDLGRFFIGRFSEARARLRGERLSIARRKAWIDIVTQILAEAAIFGCLGFLAYRAMQGRVSFGGLVIYFWALQWGRSLLNETISALSAIHQDNLFLTALHEFLALPIRLVDPEKPVKVPRPLRSGIRIERVSFRYPDNEAWALQDVSLEIKPGEKVALVGENGSGKSTLVKLLCRLYDPTAGEIQWDGISLPSFESRELRRQIGVVFQDSMTYELTARENIWLGNTEHPIDAAAVDQAAAQTGAHDAFVRLPQGYETQLGKRFEGGVDLSIGEWQKVAIARAFTRDSQILILDEPTSALDPEAEFEVFERFYELAKGKTAILISHRLSTVRMAERIFVLDRGRLIESGTHDELMNRSAKYARLFNIQALPYR